MLGAILGDIVGSPYEFDHNNYKHKDFPLLSEKSHFTDDTVMTLAVALGLIAGQGDAQKTFAEVQHEMRNWGRRYPHAGYGGMFSRWLRAEHPQPYGSFGNGSAMQVAAAGWLFDTLDKTLEMAKVTAEVTHNHPEGIKGAQATAAAIFLARTGHSKQEIRQYVEQIFGYDLSRTCDEIRPTYHHVETCQQTVPEAIIAFLESVSFEDALRNAVSLEEIFLELTESEKKDKDASGKKSGKSFFKTAADAEKYSNEKNEDTVPDNGLEEKDFDESGEVSNDVSDNGLSGDKQDSFAASEKEKGEE